MSQISESLLGLSTGHGIALALGVFLALAAAVFVTASRLANHADTIADATGIGRVWVGSVLLAASTSLPDLVTDVNAALLGAVDIGVGDLFGSTLANMMLLAVLYIVYSRRRLLHQVALDHALVGALAIVLTMIATLGVAARGLYAFGPTGAESVLIIAVYLFGMHAVFRQAAVAAVPPEQLAVGATSSSHHPPSGLRAQPNRPQAHRARVRRRQVARHAQASEVAGTGARRAALHACGDRGESAPLAETSCARAERIAPPQQWCVLNAPRSHA